MATTYDHADLDRQEWVDLTKTGGRVVVFGKKVVTFSDISVS